MLDALDGAASGHGLVFLDKNEVESRYSWAEVRERAQRVAGGLAALGVREGDTVALVFPTGVEFFDAFFGVMYAGATPVPLYPPVRLGRLDEYHARTAAMVVASRASLVLAHERVWRLLGEVNLRAKPPLGVHLLPSGAPMRLPAAHLAMVQFSSGTTVDPKPVALSHQNVLANVSAIRHFIRAITPSRHGVSWLPLYHDMGLIGCVFPALTEPGSLTLIPPELFIGRPALWLRAMSRYGACVSPAPNFAYGLAVDRIKDDEMEGVDLSAWALALNGAEPVSPGTLRRFIERFARWGLRPEAVTAVYGLAECSLGVTFADARTPFRTASFDREALAEGRAMVGASGPSSVELVAVGRPLSGIELEVATDVVSPIRVRGPSVMTGYLHQPERTAATIDANGWLDTGDLGFLHDGELYVTGRTKDVLILNGRNHAPHDVEQALDAVVGVRTGCAAAVSRRAADADSDELVVFVEVYPDCLPDIAVRCRDAILVATRLLAADIVVLAPGTLPRTSSGKIRRAATLSAWVAGTLSAPRPVGAAMMLGELTRGTLAHWRSR